MTAVTAAPKGAKAPKLTTGVAEHLTPLVIDLMALAVDAETLRAMPVALTLLGGRVTHVDAALSPAVALDVSSCT